VLGILIILLAFVWQAGAAASHEPYDSPCDPPSILPSIPPAIPIIAGLNAQTRQSQEPTQKQDTQKQDETIHLSSRLVLVPISASDSSGQPVKDLTSADITIEEDGRPQQVVSLGAPGKTPIDIGLLLDVSGSTQKQFVFEQQAAVQFITDILKSNDAVSLFSIGAVPQLVRARTANRDEAVAGLMSIMPSNDPTAFFDSIVEAAVYLDRNADPGSRRVLVVISDGEENYSKYSTLDDALTQLQKTDCLFYAINPSGGGIRLNRISLRGQGFMEAMASETGGRAFNVSKAQELEPVFGKIAAELQAQYLFGYYAVDEPASSGFRRIAVRAPRRPDLRIRARQGYYVRKN
jgi:VWFA-related protein